MRKRIDRDVWVIRQACLLAVMLVAMAGCAGGGQPKIDSAQAKGSAGQPADAEVGIVLVEDAVIGPDVQADFDAAMERLVAEDYENGIELLKKVVKRSPNATAPYINIAIAKNRLNQLELAEDNLKKALSINPDHPVANNEYGQLCRKAGRFAEARQVYERTLANYPEFHPARINLGILCDLYLKDAECALEHYQIYKAAMPDDKTVGIWIADLQRRMGQ
jgi:tetratricopeptide (TPR) repeat protein